MSRQEKINAISFLEGWDKEVQEIKPEEPVHRPDPPVPQDEFTQEDLAWEASLRNKEDVIFHLFSIAEAYANKTMDIVSSKSDRYIENYVRKNVKMTDKEFKYFAYRYYNNKYPVDSITLPSKKELREALLIENNTKRLKELKALHSKVRDISLKVDRTLIPGDGTFTKFLPADAPRDLTMREREIYAGKINQIENPIFGLLHCGNFRINLERFILPEISAERDKKIKEYYDILFEERVIQERVDLSCLYGTKEWIDNYNRVQESIAERKRLFEKQKQQERLDYEEFMENKKKCVRCGARKAKGFIKCIPCARCAGYDGDVRCDKLVKCGNFCPEHKPRNKENAE